MKLLINGYIVDTKEIWKITPVNERRWSFYSDFSFSIELMVPNSSGVGVINFDRSSNDDPEAKERLITKRKELVKFWESDKHMYTEIEL